MNHKKSLVKVISIVIVNMLFISSCGSSLNDNVADSSFDPTSSLTEEEKITEYSEENYTEFTEEVMSEDLTPPLGRLIDDGTYNVVINMHDISETSRLDIIIWEYVEMSDEEVEVLESGDIIGNYSGELIEVGEIIPVEIEDNEGKFTRYGYDYDQILNICEGYYLWHVENTNVWRLFGEFYTPMSTLGLSTCLPLSDNLLIYDQAGFVIDGGEVSEEIYTVNSFEDTSYAPRDNSQFRPVQYWFNSICVENGEVVSVTIYASAST